jgi:hypothetical protein
MGAYELVLTEIEQAEPRAHRRGEDEVPVERIDEARHVLEEQRQALKVEVALGVRRDRDFSALVLGHGRERQHELFTVRHAPELGDERARDVAFARGRDGDEPREAHARAEHVERRQLTRLERAEQAAKPAFFRARFVESREELELRAPRRDRAVTPEERLRLAGFCIPLP